MVWLARERCFTRERPESLLGAFSARLVVADGRGQELEGAMALPGPLPAGALRTQDIAGERGGEVCKKYGIESVAFKPAECIFTNKVTAMVTDAIGQWKLANATHALSAEYIATPWLVVSRELGDKYPEPQVPGASVGGRDRHGEVTSQGGGGCGSRRRP